MAKNRHPHSSPQHRRDNNRSAKDSKRNRSSKSSSQYTEDEREMKTPRSAKNDISWYSRYPNLLVAAGSFPYPNRPGMDIPMGKFNFGTLAAPNEQAAIFRVPGVLAMSWAPSFGYSASPTDPASIMAKEMYARVRAAFSGSLAADAPDYVIYLGALDSIFTYLAWLKRIYRVLNAYTPDNYMLPDGVLHAMGLRDPVIQNLRQNKTKFWQVINELVLYSRKFTCPAVMDLMNRHYWMSDNVYTDAESLNSQFYLFTPMCVYKFAMLNMPDGNPGPGLEMTRLPHIGGGSNTATVDDFYTFGRNLIDALVEWDDSYTISGYLARAYDGAQQFIVEEIPADSIFSPVYVPEVLQQIENSRTLPEAWLTFWQGDISSFNVTQDVPTNSVLSNPYYKATAVQDSFNQIKSGACLLPPMLSIRSDNPSVADSVIASRLQAGVSVTWNEGNTEATITVTSGTEIPISWTLHDLSGVYVTIPMTPCTATSNASGLANVAWMFPIEQFDWHPIAYVVLDRGQVTYRYQVYPLGDVHNITQITLDNLRNLHKICIYSELNAFNA